MQSLVRLIDRVSLACGILAAAMIALAVVIVTYMVAIRAMDYSTYWEIEFSVYLMVGATFLGSPYTLKTNGHVSVDLLPNIIPHRMRRPLTVTTVLLGMAICLYLTVTGIHMAGEALASGERSNSFWRPLVWPLYAMMPIGLGLTVLQYAVELTRLPETPVNVDAADAERLGAGRR